MSFTRSPLDEGHSTARTGAHEGLLPSVQSSVVVQGIPFSEMTITELASIFLNPTVHVHMVLEARHPVKSLSALLTNIRFYVGMFHCMKL